MPGYLWLCKQSLRSLLVIFGFLLLFANRTNAQDLLPDRMSGVWVGHLQLWSNGVKRDSVPVVLTVSPRGAERWQWKMEYRSEKNPMVKDYEWRLKDRARQLYVTDEGGGVVLEDFAYGNKMFSAFETQGIWLTSSQELRGDTLTFEVTAGKRLPATGEGVVNYGVTSLQRAVLKRQR